MQYIQAQDPKWGITAAHLVVPVAAPQGVFSKAAAEDVIAFIAGQDLHVAIGQAAGCSERSAWWMCARTCTAPT